jgi:hypothetical protein
MPVCRFIAVGEEVISIKIDPALSRLFSGGLTEAMSATTNAAAAIGQDRIARYPRPSRKKMVMTDKQRRGFFARFHSGEIEVPYRRGSSPGSETLGRRWHIRASGSINHVLTNDASYALLVHGAKDQAAYHAGNWQTDEGLADELRADGSFWAVLDQAMNKQLGGL